ncbi:MAG: NAD(+) synthase, partial [Clostridia bacterium]|nr:NAD(+) synthase [Clostridia bacterium]
MKNNNIVTIIGKIKQAKTDKKITNAELSKLSKVPLGTLNKILSGATKSVKTETLNKILSALAVNSSVGYNIGASTVIQNENYGFIKVGACTPLVSVADVDENVKNIISYIDVAVSKGVNVLVFPKLSITGASIGDLAFQQTLLNSALNGLIKIKRYSENSNLLIFVGLPIRVGSNIIDACACVCNGKILGVTPNTYLLNRFSDEARVFSFANDVSVVIDGEVVKVSNNIVYRDNNFYDFSVAVQVGEDIFNPSSNVNAVKIANIVVNPSANYEIVGSSEKVETVLTAESYKNVSSYVYANAGLGESTTDCVYAGGNIIIENGTVLAKSNPFTTGLTITDVDVSYLAYKRTRQNVELCSEVNVVNFNGNVNFTCFDRKFNKTPFIPTTNSELTKRAEFILNVQAQGLVKRIKHINAKTLVLGVSGGLDSTLALLVCKRAMDIIGKSSKDILAVTMPCFGTTERTKNNAIKMSNALNVTLKEINIKNSVLTHFKDIGHDATVTDVTFENAQARERTQVLMDVANKYNGIVIGTGDLSEMALGWATYNGDHMSMYSVNANVPKTLIRYLVGYEADRLGKDIKAVLNDVLDTPVSPELIPPTGEEIKQKTEDIVGPYILHDFYIYNALNKGYGPKKLYAVAKCAFEGLFDNATILKWLKNFYKRFFVQQFKRNFVPDVVKVGSLSYSPRGDFKIQSDAVNKIWLSD